MREEPPLPAPIFPAGTAPGINTAQNKTALAKTFEWAKRKTPAVRVGSTRKSEGTPKTPGITANASVTPIGLATGSPSSRGANECHKIVSPDGSGSVIAGPGVNVPASNTLKIIHLAPPTVSTVTGMATGIRSDTDGCPYRSPVSVKGGSKSVEGSLIVTPSPRTGMSLTPGLTESRSNGNNIHPHINVMSDPALLTTSGLVHGTGTVVVVPASSSR